MALVSFLFSFLARKASDIVQAVFGWSITALFGRLPKRSQLMVTIALVLSLAWPLFVTGVIAPNIAAWAIALVPLHDAIGEGTLRIVWTVLAVVAPLAVGLLVRAAAPHRTGSTWRALLGGYPMAFGFFAAFVIVLVTVPIIKLASIVRRWSDEHVYVQPHEHRYDDVVAALAQAVAAAGATPRIEDVPRHMMLATSVMRFFARGAVTPFIAERLQRVRADGIDLVLYPADLLLRGTPTLVARVRAMLTRTTMEQHAYLVGNVEAQAVQDDLSRLAELLDHEPQATLAIRLRKVYARLMKIDMPYDEWVILDGVARRLERRLLSQHLANPDDLPVDQAADAMAERSLQ